MTCHWVWFSSAAQAGDLGWGPFEQTPISFMLESRQKAHCQIFSLDYLGRTLNFFYKHVDFSVKAFAKHK